MSLISYETQTGSNPTITVPINCNSILVLSYSANALTIAGNTPTTKATMAEYGWKLFELLNPPTGSVSVTATGATIRTFVYFSDSSTGTVLLNEYSGTGSVIGSSTIASGETIVLFADGTPGLNLRINGSPAGHIIWYTDDGQYSAYEPGAGASIQYGADAPDYGDGYIVTENCAMVVIKIPTSSTTQSTYVTFI